MHLVRHYSCFHDALAAGLRFAGGANYAPVLVGAIGGARWGAPAISASELGHRDLRRVQAVAASLAQT